MSKRLLAIDPGSNLGWARFYDNDPVDYGTYKARGVSQDERLLDMKVFIDRVLTEFKPHTVVVEDVSRYANKNRDSRVWLMFVYSYIRIAAHAHGIPVAEVLPQSVKKATTGNAKADKDAMVAAVNARLGLTLKAVDHNTADAIAIGLYELDREP